MAANEYEQFLTPTERILTDSTKDDRVRARTLTRVAGLLGFLDGASLEQTIDAIREKVNALEPERAREFGRTAALMAQLLEGSVVYKTVAAIETPAEPISSVDEIPADSESVVLEAEHMFVTETIPEEIEKTDEGVVEESKLTSDPQLESDSQTPEEIGKSVTTEAEMNEAEGMQLSPIALFYVKKVFGDLSFQLDSTHEVAVSGALKELIHKARVSKTDGYVPALFRGEDYAQIAKTSQVAENTVRESVSRYMSKITKEHTPETARAVLARHLGMDVADLTAVSASESSSDKEGVSIVIAFPEREAEKESEEERKVSIVNAPRPVPTAPSVPLHYAKPVAVVRVPEKEEVALTLEECQQLLLDAPDQKKNIGRQEWLDAAEALLPELTAPYMNEAAGKALWDWVHYKAGKFAEESTPSLRSGLNDLQKRFVEVVNDRLPERGALERIGLQMLVITSNGINTIDKISKKLKEKDEAVTQRQTERLLVAGIVKVLSDE